MKAEAHRKIAGWVFVLLGFLVLLFLVSVFAKSQAILERLSNITEKPVDAEVLANHLATIIRIMTYGFLPALCVLFIGGGAAVLRSGK